MGHLVDIGIRDKTFAFGPKQHPLELVELELKVFYFFFKMYFCSLQMLFSFLLIVQAFVLLGAGSLRLFDSQCRNWFCFCNSETSISRPFPIVNIHKTPVFTALSVHLSNLLNSMKNACGFVSLLAKCLPVSTSVFDGQLKVVIFLPVASQRFPVRAVCAVVNPRSQTNILTRVLVR